MVIYIGCRVRRQAKQKRSCIFEKKYTAGIMVNIVKNKIFIGYAFF